MEIVPVSVSSITGSKTLSLARSPAHSLDAAPQVRRQKRSEINLISCAISSCRHGDGDGADDAVDVARSYPRAHTSARYEIPAVEAQVGPDRAH